MALTAPPVGDDDAGRPLRRLHTVRTMYRATGSSASQPPRSLSRSSPESVRVRVAMRLLGAGQRRYGEVLTRSFLAREDQGWVCRRWVTMGPFEDRRILKSDRDSVREGHRRSGSSRTVGRGEGGQNDEE